jgi:hypothetical protein
MSSTTRPLTPAYYISTTASATELSRLRVLRVYDYNNYSRQCPFLKRSADACPS